MNPITPLAKRFFSKFLFKPATVKEKNHTKNQFRGHYQIRRTKSSAFSEIHETREKSVRIEPRIFFYETFPRTFHRHFAAFMMSLIVLLIGFAFGGISIVIDKNAKNILIPYEHLVDRPFARVAKEEKATEDRLRDTKTTFSSFLMTHNIKVSIFSLALGMTWGIGTILFLFTNGVLLGAIAADYILDGQIKFLLGWLLPHGSIEIPAFLIASQAGLVLAGAIFGRGKTIVMRERLRSVSGDLVTLILGAATMLVWAGIIESFFSQYHEPIIPYEVKIAFGMIQLILLGFFYGDPATKQKELPSNKLCKKQTHSPFKPLRGSFSPLCLPGPRHGFLHG